MNDEILSKYIYSDRSVIDDTFNLDYTKLLSRDTVINFKALPFEIDGTKVKVAFADPDNVKNVESVKLQLLNLGLEVEKYVKNLSIL